ncbi:signal peptidase I [Inediibacterium massiliense]|uniref:signal peptidase I n=1 Tax=Inediibacterium massiliense TaxID=1658111 RepID=UPI0006B62599|nr:signal peptidase I [Inediibacterium massiliense]
MKEVLEWIKTIVVSILIAFVITTFVTPLIVDGVSMYPTLDDHDYLILKNTHHVQKGDIISFSSDLKFSTEELENLSVFQKIKRGETKNLIKRVIAVEGDQLLIKDGQVYVNGKKLEENYIHGAFTFGDIYIEKIPSNKIFVMGDNRENSLDSRNLGLVDLEKVQGIAVIRVFPVSKIGSIQ